MTRRSTLAALSVCLLSLTCLPPCAGAQQVLSREAQAEFLRTARVIDSAPIGKGVTKPQRLTLTDGTLTHDAAFQSVDEQKQLSSRTGRGGAWELNFRDSWRYNIAAPRVAELLGIGDMVPVSVERVWRNKVGALTWWVDDVLMDDQERREKQAQPPDKEEWNRQQVIMRVFTELVYDTDRNQGNLLIAKDPEGPGGAGWQLVMIDFTRAFRAWDKTPNPVATLRRCDRKLLDAMRRLTKPELAKAAGKYLSGAEVDGLLARRDLIVQHFADLIAKYGEKSVLVGS